MKSGAVGNASDSDAERGQKLVESAARGFIDLLGEIDRYPLDNIRQRTKP